MRPAVSIVVPCYNGGRFLDDLFATLSGQTFRDFEVIIVDDGSDEGPTRERLAALPSDVRVIVQENRGLAGARNSGFSAARGELVLPLDCDDTLDPTFLARTTAALAERGDAAFAFTHLRLCEGLSGVLPRHYDPFDQLFLNQLPYGLLMRKSAWAEAGGYDETMRDGYEDWEFNLQLVKTGARGVELPEPLFVYRVSAAGMLLSRSARMHGSLWRRIRTKHADLYRWRALAAAWRAPHERRKVSAVMAIGLLVCAGLLPDAWFGALFHRLLTASHRRRRGQEVRPCPSSAEDRHADA